MTRLRTTGKSSTRNTRRARFCRRIVDDIPHEAREHADQLLQVFGTENVYFEVQKNGIAAQDKANEAERASRQCVAWRDRK